MIEGTPSGLSTVKYDAGFEDTNNEKGGDRFKTLSRKDQPERVRRHWWQER